MTKKDYIALSKIFAGLKREKNPEAAILALAARLARTLQADNPEFDYDRFTAACRKEYER